MKRSSVNMLAWIKGLMAHQAIATTAILAVLSMYAVGFYMAGEKHDYATTWFLYINPIILLAAIVVMGQYLYQYDSHFANGRPHIAWPQWKMWSFVAGLFLTIVLWNSPINFLVHRSMTIYTIKLMGEFELAAPLLVLGIPVNVTINNKRYLYGFLRFAHNPAVSSLALLSLLVLWSMSSQMYLGLKYSVIFTLLPGAYLALGIILWMQSLKVFPSLPNLRNHLQKAGYVFVTELVMMGMGGMWFWSSTNTNPMGSSHILWGITPLSDERFAGIAMMALSLPTMCLVSWHFWRWIEDILHDPETLLFVDGED
ncbi:cytochrome c oxidase assembly protein [Acidithiobacillus ferriphilus]|uniref:cytochrome c oxidase assembly protein n=2 Tax=Acidithiobacillaceae TaxID=225058 RepID=UPI001C060ECC|nr:MULTISPECIES: cytochrome c oxidase assembly protein [Acidithiobacillus]MBU2785311.1 cytochrome c oxidase assembly protein [Acidithiobacillus ferriphilus]MBU2828065.1 cytochrome c oxidase assembly protein [Acidithiobacillus ferriphilus]MBU2846300.1 cytochrome c oxidase assembly protein [Acidithiobacillus ferriphilus]MDA8152645.1 cytochrome c oxidase assembly protein [Acidithiobacillus sp.]MDA8247107.1 cytochrome c oxidase assembly protein [Acidithiobacillus sp.]